MGYFPRGESPPRQNPPLSPSGVGARVHRTHQEAFTVFVVICEITSISMLLPGTCNPPFKNDSSASRKDTLLHLILSLYSQASATQMDTISGIHPPLQDTSFLHFTYTPLLPAHPPPNIPYYKTYVIHGIIAHKQTNLLLWLEYVF